MSILETLFNFSFPIKSPPPKLNQKSLICVPSFTIKIQTKKFNKRPELHHKDSNQKSFINVPSKSLRKDEEPEVLVTVLTTSMSM